MIQFYKDLRIRLENRNTLSFLKAAEKLDESKTCNLIFFNIQHILFKLLSIQILKYNVK